MSVRVRFAPSPTGYLHIGGARTALFNWLYARHMGGTFVLRIEDTDAARNTQEAVNVILEGLRWLGLQWDEGPLTADAQGPSQGPHGPYFQSQRKEIYARRVQELKDRGSAYERDGAVRFRMERAPVLIPDLVVGEVTRPLTDREEQDPDFVLVRSDGQPVFHFVNVVDDLEMGITHVIRGEDHLSNTAKHIALFRAFGVAPPLYAHIPLILNQDGSKMSKRDDGASLATYQHGLFLPEAVLNYLCLLGWSPKTPSEIFSAQEAMAAFDLPQIVRHNARFDMSKLKWLNSEHLKIAPPERFDSLMVSQLERAGIVTSGHAPAYVSAALATYREKHQQLIDHPESARFYFSGAVSYDSAEAQKHLTTEALPRLALLKARFAALEEFEAAHLEAGLKAAAVEMGVKPGLLVHPLRLACTGQSVGPSLYHLMAVLGREQVMLRLDAASLWIGRRQV